MAFKSITIHPGEKIAFPSGTTISSVVTTGVINLSSSCDDLPSPTTYKCGYFYIVVDNDDNSGTPMDESNTSYVDLTVGSNVFTIGELVVQGTHPGVATTISTLNTHITDLGIFEFMGITQHDYTKRSVLNVFFKAPEDLFDTIRLQVIGQGSEMLFPPRDAVCGEYPDAS